MFRLQSQSIVDQTPQPSQPATGEYPEQAEYCVGMSVNADLFWKKGTDVTFLTYAGHQTIVNLLNQAANAGHMKIVDTRLTTYGQNPQFGFSYLVVLGQSHIMIHTWPEQFFLNIDIFTCGNEGDPLLIYKLVKDGLKPHAERKNEMERGLRKDIKDANENPA